MSKSKSVAMYRTRMNLLLRGLPSLLRVGALRDAAYRKRLRETNMIAQIRTRDGLTARWYEIRNGRIRSRSGLHEHPDVCLTFANARIGTELLTPPIRWDRQVHAQKNFQIDMEGPGDQTFAFAQLIMGAKRAGWRFGTAMRDGSVRYTSMTNGGPCFVYARDGRILRITPIDFDDDDAASWTVTARGKTFTPPRKATVSPHTLNFRSVIYSKDRLLHPMKRVDFDPAGERNPQNRGRSGYERISWDEAFDLVATEITRVKKDHGHGAITFHHPSHHNWGNVGYWLSALYRFANSVGHTKINHNPDSWEGWFWGAVHHWGNTMRFGPTSPYGTMQDLLDEAELVVFWSSDPETTSGAYAGHEGTVRRQWLKTLGIECIHIDPYYNHTAAFLGGRWIAPRPGTDTALALAIAYVWIKEGLYDRWFVENRTHGFDAWKAYILGEDDGIAKSPAWQEPETGVPARVVTALARRWGTRKTYLSAGGWGGGLGGACRGPTGIQWARAMACLMALQGMGKPGVNFGNLQFGAPVDQTVWFPGYADGGISGDLIGTGSAMALYTRMPHLPTVNTPMQQIPRLHLPEAITGGRAAGEIRDPRAISGQFLKGGYPAPGHAEVRMLYRYGSSNFGTMPESRRYEDMYRSPSLEFVVNQSIWMEGEVPFADVILPACTNFERWDISEWSNSGGPILHAQNQCNHRVITLQHKCIEPLGESRPDYEIFHGIAIRLGLGDYYSEGMSDLDWVKRMFDASDLPQQVSWKEFCRKGYYVVPAASPVEPQPVDLRWFYEGRLKDLPEPFPLPSEYKDGFRKGLQTPTGLFEFECESLKRATPDDLERPPIVKYARSREDVRDPRGETYPLQLLTPHSRYSFHSHADGKDSFVNDIRDHRLRIDGHYYWILRIGPDDAHRRGIKSGDLVKVYNERGAVLCAALVTARLRQGIVHGYESAAVYDPVTVDGTVVDRGGCLNILTPKRTQIANAHSMGNSNCLVEVERMVARPPAGAAESPGQPSAAPAGAPAGAPVGAQVEPEA